MSLDGSQKAELWPNAENHETRCPGVVGPTVPLFLVTLRLGITKNPSDFSDRMLVRLVSPQPRQAKYEGARKGVFSSSVFRFPNVSMQQNETTLPHSKTPSAHLLEGGCSMESPSPIRPFGYTRWGEKTAFCKNGWCSQVSIRCNLSSKEVRSSGLEIPR